MSLYAGSALGLLMTTCFLGLRRYLRQRNVKMPAAMTSVWLTSGGVLVVVLLVLGALLPRPNAEYRLLDLTPLGNDERQASKVSVKKDSAGKDKGQPGEQSGDNEKGEGNNGKDKPKDAGGKEGKDGKDKDGKDKGGKNKDGKDKGGGEPKKGEPKTGEPKSETDREIAEQKSATTSALKDVVQQLTTLLKWLAFIAVGLIVAAALLTGGLRYLANFTQWARELLEWLRNLWARLFGGTVEEKKSKKQQEAAAKEEYEDRPFSWFRNPWTDGTAEQRRLQELIRFTFAALQAWAAERGVLREIGETPLEFAARVGEEAPGLAEDVDRFVALYLREEYAKGKLPAASVAEVRHFWDRLELAAEQPLSA
jgi:Domain of unknown function (DUF4129)